MAMKGSSYVGKHVGLVKAIKASRECDSDDSTLGIDPPDNNKRGMTVSDKNKHNDSGFV